MSDSPTPEQERTVQWLMRCVETESKLTQKVWNWSYAISCAECLDGRLYRLRASDALVFLMDHYGHNTKVEKLVKRDG